MRNLFFVLAATGLLASCNGCNNTNNTQADIQTQTDTVKPIAVLHPEFIADSAFEFVGKQVSFGPRVPNTKGHDACGEWIIARVKKDADTYYVQKFDALAYDGKKLKSSNIIASYNPTAAKRILLVAHWDTRHIADQDKDRPNEPILGANDGGSGVGVLLEVARNLQIQKLKNIGVDILFVDSEDYGQPANSGLEYMPDSYCLGSQHWGIQPHIPDYKADFGILLDMVGAPGALFTREGVSRNYAGWVLDRVWANAQKLGYGNYFSNVPTDPITDDHKYINDLRKIPTIDIIHYDATTPSGFGAYWHTHNDDMDVVDRATLNAVGHTLLYTIYQYDAEMTPQ